MLELLLVPTTALTIAFVSDRLKKKMDDKKKIQVFFEVAGITIRKSDQLHYPKFKNKILDDRSTTYV
ncbi:cell division protein FtsK, partial [Bacillus thuringiensis]